MLAFVAILPLLAFADDPVLIAPKPIDAAAPISAVTLYQGRAAITRTARLAPGPGVWDVRFTDLPPSVDGTTLQATTSDPATVIDVRFETSALDRIVTSDPAVAALDKEIETLSHTTRELGAKRATLNASIELLNAISVRLADHAGKTVGTESLDPGTFRKQVESLAAQRDEILGKVIVIEDELASVARRSAAAIDRRDATGATTRTARTGVVTVAVPESVADGVEVELTYLVGKATWTPRYAVRAASDLSGLSVEYDATIVQATGEDWNDVRLTLSTAQPTETAEPPTLDPIYVDLAIPVVASKSLESAGYGYRSPPPPPKPGNVTGNVFGSSGEDAERAADAADVVQNAVAATFVLPRTVTMPTAERREQKTRIASIDLKPEYTYVTRPAVDSDAYLRGKTRNDSPFQLLAGNARIFLGGDSVGTVDLPDVAPGADIELWFGADRRVSVERNLVAKNTATTGLISKANETTWQYRIDVKSALAAPATLEVWDRIPVSRDDKIAVTLRNVSPPLSNEPSYEANERKQGLLKWIVSLPKRPSAKAPAAVSIGWSATLSKPVDVATTPVPE